MMKKRWVRAVLLVVALIIAAVVLLPFFINANTFRPIVQDQLSSALGRKVTLGHLSFSLLSGSLVANNIAIADDPAFGTAPFIQAKSFYIGVEVLPLLFHHQVRITRLTIDSPSIHLIQNQKGVWNFASLGAAAAASRSGAPAAIPSFTVGQLTIKNGSAAVSSIPATGKPFDYSKVDIQLSHFSLENSFPFQLSANLPGSGSLHLSGVAGPLSKTNAAETPFKATLHIKHLDPVAAGLVAPDKGISMVADIDSNLASNGSFLTSQGKIQAAHLQLARTGSPAPKPVNIDYAVSNNLAARTGQLSNLAIHTGSVAVHVTGGFQFTNQAVLLNLHLSAPNLPIDQLEALLPAFGVQLPSGSALRGGTLTANLAITGPATATTINGPVQIANTRLAGFDLGSRIQGLNPMGGTSGGTSIQSLRTNVNSTPQVTEFSNIYGFVPAIGTATGSGSVTPAGALNFNLVAKLNGSTGVGGMATQASKTFGGLFGKVLRYTVNKGIPMTITGTAANPSIRANVGAMLR
jgi:AsmA protein